MPRRPLLFPHEPLALPHLARQYPHHEKGELGRRFGQNIGRIRERNFVLVSVGTVDVVEANRNLCHDFK